MAIGFRYLPIPGLSFTAFADGLTPFKDESGTIKISDGTAYIPVMKLAARQIMKANRNIVISIAGGGSGVGIKQVGEGLVDIGNSGRKPSDAELAELNKYSLTLHQWAIDRVGIVVNPDNPVKALKGWHGSQKNTAAPRLRLALRLCNS